MNLFNMDKTFILDTLKTVLNEYSNSKYITVTFDEDKTILNIYTNDYVDKLGIIDDVKAKINVDIIVNLIQGETYLLQRIQV